MGDSVMSELRARAGGPGANSGVRARPRTERACKRRLVTKAHLLSTLGSSPHALFRDLFRGLCQRCTALIDPPTLTALITRGTANPLPSSSLTPLSLSTQKSTGSCRLQTHKQSYQSYPCKSSFGEDWVCTYDAPTRSVVRYTCDAAEASLHATLGSLSCDPGRVLLAELCRLRRL